MRRTLAMIAAFLICTAIGMAQASKLRNRVKGITELLEGVRGIALLMKFNSRSLYEILSQLQLQRECVLWKYLANALMQNYSFESAWKTAFHTAVKEDAALAALKNSERDVMTALARELGRSDLTSQQKRLQLAEAQLMTLYDNAVAETEKKERLYRALGISAGLISAVMIW